MHSKRFPLFALVLLGLLTACGSKPEVETELAASGPLDTLVLAVNGMTCDGCVETVSLALKKVPGVQSASVSLADANATVVITDGPGEEFDALVAAVTGAGYSVGGQEAALPDSLAMDSSAVEVAVEPAAGH
jgi:copper chaperone CopZ